MSTSPYEKLSEQEKKQMIKEIQEQAYEALLYAFGVEKKMISDDVKNLLNIEQESAEEKRKMAYEATLLAATFSHSLAKDRDGVLATLKNQLHITDDFHRECQNRVRNNILVVQLTGEASGSNYVGETGWTTLRRISNTIFRF
ncbi:hypothetical protein [Arabidopsis thaliana]|uniref:Emsy N Terminus (ENT) domain-containing protein n=1 Tax=Arabidopsis thaliana TaxID=3702 RepID=Q9M2M2_ARATH|nr:Emsy N Terminus (ENT) domain-containing protein [Arabidopsis thaliana]AEE79632.1 Emsy N Terminus (ENT) domain-containing protein [Arabidopsis thaliana]CAB68131.1 hypothetical protein [Arabidopsis thaliana]|eukprot:NP_191284.1 Emsy N Terminus (ENT) domain-containing protein [Arabidopsis thaliana]